tara:strand:- start:17 stop:814 length:798 start_codon:yes stop_codon:yes gene_type:complete
MSKFARGKYAQFISDRSGQAFPYNEMVIEWNGSRVHISEFEPKQPQLEPRAYGSDPQGLQNAKPARTEFATQEFLPNDPFVTASNTTLKISFPNGDLSVNDHVRFQNVKNSVGGLAITTLQLSTTLNGAISDSATSIDLTDATEFPSSGFIMIEKVNSNSGLFVNEVIQYTGKSTNQLTGCTRGTSAPFRGVSPVKTTATSHADGAKVFGSFKVASLNTTTVVNAGQPATLSQFDGINVTLANAATSTATGGGFQCTIGPINDRG